MIIKFFVKFVVGLLRYNGGVLLIIIGLIVIVVFFLVLLMVLMKINIMLFLFNLEC